MNITPITDYFPIEINLLKGIPINAHPGAFGCARKFNYHEGVDLYGTSGDSVFAIRSGIVVANRLFTGPQLGTSWWLETDAVIVQDETGYFVYGELKSNLKEGEQISAGDKIGELVPVLPDYKIRTDIPGHSVTMLHLERYNNNYNVDEDFSSWEIGKKRPSFLVDPTIDLINILTSHCLDVKFLTI